MPTRDQDRPPYSPAGLTFTLVPADALSVCKFKGGVMQISFGNAHIAESFWEFAREAGIQRHDATDYTPTLATLQRTQELEKQVKELDAEVKEQCDSAVRERNRKIEVRERNAVLEAKIEHLETRINALQEALTDAAVRDLQRKDGSDTSS